MKLKFEIPVKVFKQDNAWIYFNKKYNISGYGETKSRAKEMFLFSVDVLLAFSAPVKMFPNAKPMGGEELKILNKTYERLLSKTPTSFTKKNK